MTAKNRADIQTEIDTELADNGVGAIAATNSRTVAETSKDSNLNLLDTANQTVVGEVDFAGGLKTNGEEVLSTPEIVYIRSESDWPASTDDAGVNTHTLLNKEYWIIGDQSHADPIGFPGFGLTAVIKHVNRAVLTYTGTDSQFYDTNAQGRVELNGLTSYKAPAGSFFDITAVAGVFSLQATGGAYRFDGCLSLGKISGNGLSSVSFDVGTMFNFNQGLIFENMRYQEINRALMAGNNSSSCVYLTSQGASTTGSIIFNKITMANGTNETAFDIKSEVQAGIDNCAFDGCLADGGINGAVFAVGSLTNKDNEVIASANSIMGDSIPGGLLSLSTNTTETVIASLGTPVMVAGVWIVEDESQFSGTPGGRLTSNALRDISVDIDAGLSLQPTSGNDRNLRAYIAKNGVVIPATGKTVTASNGDPQNLSLSWRLDMVGTNYIEVFVENNTNTNNIIVTDATLRIP